jgi:hypothetical protein
LLAIARCLLQFVFIFIIIKYVELFTEKTTTSSFNAHASTWREVACITQILYHSPRAMAVIARSGQDGHSHPHKSGIRGSMHCLHLRHSFALRNQSSTLCFTLCGSSGLGGIRLGDGGSPLCGSDGLGGIRLGDGGSTLCGRSGSPLCSSGGLGGIRLGDGGSTLCGSSGDGGIRLGLGGSILGAEFSEGAVDGLVLWACTESAVSVPAEERHVSHKYLPLYDDCFRVMLVRPPPPSPLQKKKSSLLTIININVALIALIFAVKVW